MQFEVKNFSVRMNDKMFLHDVNFSVDAGKTIVINGVNGSGKSTLLKAIAGFSDYDCAGEILIDGKNISSLDTVERAQLGIFLTLQEPIEIAGLSYAEMLKAAMDARGKISAKDFQLRLAQSLEVLQLDPFMAQKHVGSDLSGGEKKKMEVLQILMLEPSIVLLDEIDSGLDTKSARHISNVLREYQQKHNASFVVVTHNKQILSDLLINNDYQLEDKTLTHA